MIWSNATFKIIISLLVDWSPANEPRTVDTQTPFYHYLVKCHNREPPGLLVPPSLLVTCTYSPQSQAAIVTLYGQLS